MARPVWVEWTQVTRIGSVRKLEFDRTNKATDSWEQEFGITHRRWNFEGRDAEIAKIGRMPEIAQNEDRTQRHENHPNERV
jgi:hypothetical protein